jgi:2-polyprenyl-6-methoxyphenol hydroxylase-like FAD-dependent oxidoreductase
VVRHFAYLASDERVRPRKLIGLAKEAICVRDVAYPPLEEVVHEDHKVVLVGDAAHPTVVRRHLPSPPAC